MWKLCWDCIAGQGINSGGQDNNASVRIPLNGETRKLPLCMWPGRDKMTFLLPRQLNFEDTFNITGTLNMSSGNNISVCLGTRDDNEVAFEFFADFSNDTVTLKRIKNGVERYYDPEEYNNHRAMTLFPESSFHFAFRILSSGNGAILQFFAQPETQFCMVDLEHNIEDIAYLRLNGDTISTVENLTFSFV